MLLRSTAKSWRGATAKARVAPDRTSKSYRAGRAIGQLARGKKPTKYKQPTGENQVKGKKNVANIAAYRDGLRFDYAYDADSGDLYDVRYGMQYDPANKRYIGLDGGIRVTNLMNVKEYRPTDFGNKHAQPGMVPGRGTKGRKYTGVDAVVKALRDEGGDVYVLDKSPGKQKKASTTSGTVNWRSPIQATGEYIDPRKRHEIPTGPGDGAGTGYMGNPAKDAHNMYWRRTLGMSEQEKLAAGVLARGTAQDTLRKAYGQSWRGPGPNNPPPPTGPSPKGPSSPGPQPGSPTGPSTGTGFGGSYEAWLKRQGIDPGNMGGNWRPKPQGPPGTPPGGQTPGPPPSQNQANQPPPPPGTPPAGAPGGNAAALPRPKGTGIVQFSPQIPQNSRADDDRAFWERQAEREREIKEFDEWLADFRRRKSALDPKNAPGTGIVPVNPQPFRYAEPSQQAPQADTGKSWRNPQEGDQRGEYVYSGGQWVHNPAPVQQGRPFSFNMEGTKYKPEEVQAHRYADQFIAQHATNPDIDPNFDVDQFLRDLEIPVEAPEVAKVPGTAIQLWRRPKIRIPNQPIDPLQAELEGPDAMNAIEGWVGQKSRDWYAQKEGAKTFYGTGPKARKLRPGEAKTAKRSPRKRFVPGQPLPPEPDIPVAPLALDAPQTAVPQRQWQQSRRPNVAVAAPTPDPAIAAIYKAENRLAGNIQRHEMERMAASRRNKPYPMHPEVARDIELAHQGNYFGTNPAFESEELVTPEGFQVQPQTISLLAKTLSDTERARRGKIDTRKIENPFEYRTNVGPDTIPFGTEGDMRIEGYRGIGNRLLDAIRQEQATNPQENVDYDRAIKQVMVDFDAPGLTLERQKGLMLAAKQAEEEGNLELAKKLRGSAEEIAFESFRRSPKMLDAFSTIREDTGGLTRGSYLSAPQQDESRINVLTRPEYARLKEKMESGEPLSFDEEYQFKRQTKIDEANLGFSRATGQGGSNPANTKMFNTVAMSSPVPWADDKKELFSQIPSSLLEETALDAQFSRELANPKLGNSRFDYEFQPESYDTATGALRQDVPASDQIAALLSGRLASVSRYGASLGFASNSVEAARNREMLQGQDGDEGFAPQGTSTHWSNLGTVEQQLEAIQGGGKVPGMDDVARATYDATIDEYRAKAEDFLASLPPDMPEDQFNAAVNEFMRGEFNARVQSDYERLRNPESDLVGGHNVFRMPNTKSMIQDDPTKSTLQQVFDGAIPEIVMPQSGDPFDAWNDRLRKESSRLPGLHGPESELNVINAYGMVDEGIREKAQSFYNDAGGTISPEVELAAQRFMNVPERPEDRIRPPAGLAIDMTNDLEGPPVAAQTQVRKGLRRSGGRSAQRVSYPDQVRNEMNLSEKMIDAARQTTEKQMIRQDKYIFGDNPGQNTQRIEADQLAIGDVVNLHVPTKKGGKLERAEVIDAGDGTVILKDGPKLGNIILDIDDPTRSAINVHSIEPYSEPPNPTQPAASAQNSQSIDTGNKKANKGPKNPGIEYAALERLYGTPFEQILSGEIPKILTPKNAALKAKAKGLRYASGYDNAGGLSSFWSSKIFSKDGLDPDEVHGHLVSKGLMREDSTPDEMFDEIYKGISNYEKELELYRGEQVAAQQQERVRKEVFSSKSSKRNPVAIKGRDLSMGQKVEIAVPNARGRKDQTEIAEVVGIDEDGNALLEDGPRYGPFTVRENDTIYGKRILDGDIQPGDDPWNDPESFDMPQPAEPGAFSLSSEPVNQNYATSQGLLLDIDPNEIERQLIEEQRRKNRKRLSGQSDFLDDIPF